MIGEANLKTGSILNLLFCIIKIMDAVPKRLLGGRLAIGVGVVQHLIAGLVHPRT